MRPECCEIRYFIGEDHSQIIGQLQFSCDTYLSDAVMILIIATTSKCPVWQVKKVSTAIDHRVAQQSALT